MIHILAARQIQVFIVVQISPGSLQRFDHLVAFIRKIVGIAQKNASEPVRDQNLRVRLVQGRLKPAAVDREHQIPHRLVPIQNSPPQGNIPVLLLPPVHQADRSPARPRFHGGKNTPVHVGIHFEILRQRRAAGHDRIPVRIQHEQVRLVSKLIGNTVKVPENVHLAVGVHFPGK